MSVRLPVLTRVDGHIIADRKGDVFNYEYENSGGDFSPPLGIYEKDRYSHTFQDESSKSKSQVN